MAFGSNEAVRAWLDLRGHLVRNGRHGAMDGNEIGDAFGAGGLGVASTGIGGGGSAEGSIGLGSLGTMGAGNGSGQGYGSGAGPGRAGARPAPPPATRVGAAPSMTNNQVEGVEEGDIVKAHGDHLVVLRRGRLFSVRTGNDALAATAMVNAWGPGRRPGGWYDEMLVEGDTVIVIGYSYAARATEVGLFDIDAEGAIRWRDTLFVRSSDYYSSRNYASRLVGRRLVMYMPVPLRVEAGGAPVLPAVRHGVDAAWETVVDYARLYRPVQAMGYGAQVHTVMTCDLSGRGFDCSATGVVGPASRNFYVSESAVYLWVQDGHDPANPTANRDGAVSRAVLYRLPLNRDEPSAARVRGAPLDQFSFDERDGAMRVLLRAEGHGDAMWGAEHGAGDVGLLNVPLRSLTAAVPDIEAAAYKGLGRIEGSAHSMHNRFVGDHVLFGVGESGWRGRTPTTTPQALFVHSISRAVTTRLAVTHGIERIEPLGRDALAVGGDGRALTLTSIALDETPSIAARHVMPGFSQGESRSHGFFFAPSGDRVGVLGLPVTRGNDGGGWMQLRNVSSAVTFLSVDGLRLRALGSLQSRAGGVNDRCIASCADWYGNARPIFWQGRTFALLGYELVEGATTNGTLRERRRVDIFRTPANASRSPNAFDNLEAP
jgi:hypothetical protein